jgi:hypothetical protein
MRDRRQRNHPGEGVLSPGQGVGIHELVVEGRAAEEFGNAAGQRSVLEDDEHAAARGATARGARDAPEGL